ncbi:Frataxin-like domain family protein [Babesia bovis T2Bo]|uniref:Frataxin-like domain family protein n=1 Tax=Babesia bovis T2Bo TaxID=484906 RepID=UPI001D1BB7C4|nr:Frataxin-like domain family protein [Babesia bovis T2Bo]KAG6439964.1 Frataxin-like domain family protein [Babesia bovis T2Bo]
MLRGYRRFFGTIKIHQFNEAALNKLQALHDSLESVEDVTSLSFDGTVLSAEIEPNHYIVINKHEASQQIWYSSFSGVDYFSPENGKWKSNRTGRELGTAVQSDVLAATGKLIDINNVNS